RVERSHASEFIKGFRKLRVAPEDTFKAVAALKNQPEVLYAEPNYILRGAAVPNDQFFNLQYGPTKVGAQQVWDQFTTGSTDVVVAVLDQGIDVAHLDLKDNIWTNPAETPGNSIDDDGNGFKDDVNGFNFVDNNGTLFSGNNSESHATHVAGIIGARGNNLIGVTGMNWQLRLMSLKFLAADNTGTAEGAAATCTYAAQMRQLWETSGHAKGANIRVVNA